MSGDPLSQAAAHQAALDHVLALVAGAPWGDEVVLRGSRVLAAWFGPQAREPADLDFVVLPVQAAAVDRQHPYPFVDSVQWVQQWPEAADGAAGYEIFRDDQESFDGRGFRPRTPPEGLTWLTEPDEMLRVPSWEDMCTLIESDPWAAPGIVLDADATSIDGTWGYDYGSGLEGGGGVRVHVPWHGAGGAGGRVRLDFAHDDRLPEPPVWTLIPSAHHRYPVLIQTAGREVSLAWKLLWLYRDAVGGDAPQCKDLYDAVLLAEDPRTDLSPRLLRRVVRDNGLTNAVALGAVCPGEDAWQEFLARCPQARGSARDWLDRLAAALAPILAALPG